MKCTNIKNAVSSSLNNNVEVDVDNTTNDRRGRPKYTKLESLEANAKKCFKNFKVSEAGIVDKIDMKSISSHEDQETLRGIQKERFYFSTKIDEIDEQQSTCTSESMICNLKARKKNFIKELNRLPLEGQFCVDDEKSNKIGQPNIHDSVYHIRNKRACEQALLKLNKYKTKKGLSPTSMIDLKNMLLEDEDKPKIGRVKNKKIDNLDKSIKAVNNRIYHIKENIAQESHNKKMRGRRRHSVKELEKAYKNLAFLNNKVLKYEAKLSKYELSKRRLKQFKSLKQGLKRKIHSVIPEEYGVIKRQIFEVSQKIVEEENRLSFINENETVEKIEQPVMNDCNYIDKNKLLQVLVDEKDRMNEKHKYLAEFINQVLAIEPLPKTA